VRRVRGCLLGNRGADEFHPSEHRHSAINVTAVTRTLGHSVREFDLQACLRAWLGSMRKPPSDPLRLTVNMDPYDFL
jgi:hypothetical protein